MSKDILNSVKCGEFRWCVACCLCSSNLYWVLCHGLGTLAKTPVWHLSICSQLFLGSFPFYEIKWRAVTVVCFPPWVVLILIYWVIHISYCSCHIFNQNKEESACHVWIRRASQVQYDVFSIEENIFYEKCFSENYFSENKWISYFFFLFST